MSFSSSPLFAKLARVLLRHRLASALTYLCICVVIGLGAAKLKVDFSARAFFGGDPEGLADLDAHQAVWGKDDGFLVVTAQVKDGTLLEKGRLAEVVALSHALEELEGVQQTVGLMNLRLPRSEGGLLAFRAIPDAMPDDEREARAFAAELLRDRALVPAVLSREGRVTGIAVELSVPPDDIAAVRPVVARITALAAEHESTAGVSFAVAGTPVVRAAMLGLILGDQTLFVPLAFALMALLLFLLYRRFHGVALPLLVAGIPAGLVMGIMGYAGEPIGVINQVYFTLLPVIAVSGGIHLLSRYYEEAERTGTHGRTLLPIHKEAAVFEAVRHVGGACLVSAATTVIGLLSLQVSAMPILKSFGLYSAIGVSFAFVTLVVMVPLILVTSRARARDPARSTRRSPVDLFLAACAHLVLERTRLCVVFGLLGGAGFGLLGTLVVVDNSLAGMLEREHEVTRAGALVDEHLGGLVSLEIDLRGKPSAFDDPALLVELLAFERRLKERADVRVVQGPAALVRRTHEALTGEARLPETRELSAQLSFLQDGSGYYDAFLSDDRSRARVVLRTADVGGRRFAALERELQEAIAEWLKGPAARAQEVDATLTGTASLSYGGVNRLAEDLRLAILSAFLIVLGLIFFIFRSARIALITVVPNALPIVCGYGLMGWLGWPLEPGPAVVFTVALGIAVDDTIHILARAAEASEEQGLSHAAAIREAIVHTGRPVVITSIILSAGFAINMLSAFPNNARVGALGAFVILVALVADLFVLPALLLLFGKGAFKGRARTL